MKQLTIRGFDDHLERRIRQLARAEGISLNRAVLKLLRRGAGLGEGTSGRDVVGNVLDHLMGTWTAEEGAYNESDDEVALVANAFASVTD